MIIHYMYTCNNFVLANEYDVEFLINTSVISHYGYKDLKKWFKNHYKNYMCLKNIF